MKITTYIDPKRTILLFFFVLVFLLGLSCQKAEREEVIEPMKNLSGKKVLFVIAPSDFRDDEYSEPRAILEGDGAEIKVASLQKGKSKGAQGTEVEIDLAVSEVDVSDFDGVVFVGGPGMVDLVNRSEFVDLARKFFEADKLTSAICISPVILANAGILSGKSATVFPGNENKLTSKGANYTGQDVCRDGKIITASGPTAAKDFGRAVAGALAE